MKQKGEKCIVEYLPEEYSRYYIVQALFKLMNEYEFEKIGVSDIARKAGVGRATFYRYFKRKEDVIVYYFEHNTKDFVLSQRFFPRCKEDYVGIAKSAFTAFKKNIGPMRLLRKAHLEYIYLGYLNRMMAETFSRDYESRNAYAPYLYAGMLFNVSMAWLDNDCKESVEELAEMFVDAIYFDA